MSQSQGPQRFELPPEVEPAREFIEALVERYEERIRGLEEQITKLTENIEKLTPRVADPGGAQEE